MVFVLKTFVFYGFGVFLVHDFHTFTGKSQEEHLHHEWRGPETAAGQCCFFVSVLHWLVGFCCFVFCFVFLVGGRWEMGFFEGFSFLR